MYISTMLIPFQFDYAQIIHQLNTGEKYMYKEKSIWRSVQFLLVYK